MQVFQHGQGSLQSPEHWPNIAVVKRGAVKNTVTRYLSIESLYMHNCAELSRSTTSKGTPIETSCEAEEEDMVVKVDYFRPFRIQ